MNKQKIAVFLSVVLLVAGAAGILAGFKARQRQGKPGLKLVDQPSVSPEGKILRPVSVQLPEKVLDYVSTNLPVRDIEFNTLPKDTTYGRRSYVKEDGFFTDISVVLMGTDRTSIHKPQICLTGQGWKIDKSERVLIPMDRPHRYELPAMKLIASKQARDSNGQLLQGRAIFIYWFVSENRLTAEHRERMWATVEDLVKTGVMPRWGYVSCLSVCKPGQEEIVYQRMAQLIAAAVPEFQLTTAPSVAKAALTTAAVR